MSDADEKDLVVDLDSVWRQQSVGRDFSDALLMVAEVAAMIITTPEAGVNNVTEWSKKQACWAMLQRTDAEYGPELMNCLVEPEEARAIQREG